MTSRRARGRLFTKRTRVLASKAQQQAAKNQAAMIRKIRKTLVWPTEWLARLNSEGIPPDGAPSATHPTWRLVVDALRDLARAAQITQSYERAREDDFVVTD